MAPPTSIPDPERDLTKVQILFNSGSRENTEVSSNRLSLFSHSIVLFQSCSLLWPPSTTRGQHRPHNNPVPLRHKNMNGEIQ